MLKENVQKRILSKGIQESELHVINDENCTILSFNIQNNETILIVNVMIYSEQEADIMVSKYLPADENIYKFVNDLNLNYRNASFFYNNEHITIKTFCNGAKCSEDMIMREITNNMKFAKSNFNI